MFPHERSLVKRHSDRPFALVGINSDTDIEVARESVRKNNLTWRSFWNGPEGTEGPIASRWNVLSWPTVYLIDHEGVIRHHGLRGEELDRALDALIAAVPK